MSQLVVPAGTQVVTRAEVKSAAGEILCPAGAVGAVVETPGEKDGFYRIRFPDGAEALLRRQQFSIRKQLQKAGLLQAGPAGAGVNLLDCVIYRCVVGSTAYGLAEEGSDLDRRGIFLPPAEIEWSLFDVPEQIESRSPDTCFWELEKFLKLALKANPNILECLYTPLVELAMPPAEELLALRSIFLSRLIYQTYNGYVLSQFKKLEQDLRARGEIKWKHAMHLIRLLLAGITALKEGFVPVRVEEHRDRLLSIRRGEIPWREVEAWRLSLQEEFDAAFRASRLPEQPDYEHANAFLIKARRSMVHS